MTTLVELPSVLLDEILHALLRRPSTARPAAIRDLLCVASACRTLRPHIDAITLEQRKLSSTSPLLRLFTEALQECRFREAADQKVALPVTLPGRFHGFPTASAAFLALLRCKVDADAPGGPSFGGVYKSRGRIQNGHREVRAVSDEVLKLEFMCRMESSSKHELVFVFSPGAGCRSLLSCVPDEHVRRLS